MPPQGTCTQRKQEQLGRAHAYQRLLPPAELLAAMKSGEGSLWDLTEALGMPEGFIAEAINYYQRKGTLDRGVAQCHWCRAKEDTPDFAAWYI